MNEVTQLLQAVTAGDPRPLEQPQVGASRIVEHGPLEQVDERLLPRRQLPLKAPAAVRLADMENPAPPFGVTVEMEGGETAFGIGERVSGFRVPCPP